MGHASFNQVFFTDAKVPQKSVGRVGDGWKVAMTTLAHGAAARMASRRHQKRGRQGRVRIHARSGLKPKRPTNLQMVSAARWSG